MPSSMPMTPEDLDRLARRRANAKLGWYVHALAFVLVNALILPMSRYARLAPARGRCTRCWAGGWGWCCMGCR